MTNSPKALIFDLGKVVFDVSFDNAFSYWSKVSGKSFSEIKTAFQFGETYEQFEVNAISPSEFRAQISQILGIEISDEDFDAGWCNIYLDVYPGMDELLSQLKKKYRLAGLTNTNSIHEKVWVKRYEKTLIHFEKVFSSHRVHTRKPDEKAYQTVIDYLQLQPNEIIFLDDNLQNVTAAEKPGMKGIHVTSFTQMKKEIEALP